MRGFNGFTDRQVGMGALQPSLYYEQIMRTVGLVPRVLEAGRDCCSQYIKHHFDTSVPSGLIPSLFACKGLRGHCNKSKYN